MGGTPMLLKMQKKRSDLPIHLILITIAAITLLPFVFVINNSFRRTSEQYHSFFGVPSAVSNLFRFTGYELSGQSDRIQVRIMPEPTKGKPQSVRATDVPLTTVTYGQAMRLSWRELTRGYDYAWQIFRPFMINSLLVSIGSAIGVVVIASATAYVFSC